MITDFAMGASIGDVLELDTLSGSLVDTGYNVGIDIKNLQNYVSQIGDKSDLITSNGTKVTATFDANANLPQVAQGDLSVTFSQTKSEYIALKAVWYEVLDRIEIEPQLEDIWTAKGFSNGIINRHKYLLVTTVMHAASGIYLYSDDANVTVGLKASGAVPSGAVTTDVALSGNVTFEKSSVTSIIEPNPITKIFQVQRNLLVPGWQVFA